jgi:hypothetical protein
VSVAEMGREMEIQWRCTKGRASAHGNTRAAAEAKGQCSYEGPRRLPAVGLGDYPCQDSIRVSARTKVSRGKE